jgi:hypothetical protein
VNIKGSIPTQGFGLAAMAAYHGQWAKRLNGSAAVSQADCHIAQATLATQARRERGRRGHHVRCANCGAVTGGG